MSAPRTLPEALARAARTGSGFTFLGGSGAVSRSYAELRDSSLGVARAFCEAGLRRGDLVALVISDTEQFLTAFLGASTAGVVPAPLYPPATTGDLSRYLDATVGVLRSAGARAVVTTSALRPEFERLRPRCPDLELVLASEALDAPPLEPGRPVTADDIAFVQFTSGSTSRPKGVVLSHRTVWENVHAFSGPAGLSAQADDVAVGWLPLYHDMGLIGMALGALYSGCRAVLMEPQLFVKRPVEWLRAISGYRGTISFAPNFAYDLCVRRVKDRDLDALDLSTWRVAGCGAEPINAGTLAAFAGKMARVGFRATSFVPSYGLAEHVLAAALPPRGRAPRVERVLADDLAKRRVATPDSSGDAPTIDLVSCGRALPGHRIRIVDEWERELPERQVGEIALAGPSVMVGYYKQDALTAQAIRGGWLHTGDLGYLAGGELFVCGRVKDVIIVNGLKYHPQDLEWGVDDLAGVRRGRVVAFGSSDPDGGRERVVMVAEPTGTVAVDALVGAIRRRVVDLCGLYVDEVIVAPSGTIGRTTSGKVQRAATKARYERGALVGADADAAGLHL